MTCGPEWNVMLVVLAVLAALSVLAWLAWWVGVLAIAGVLLALGLAVMVGSE